MLKDKITGEKIEIRALKFTLPKDKYDYIRGVLDMYKSICLREYGQQINDNKALEFMVEEARQTHQDDFKIIKEV